MKIVSTFTTLKISWIRKHLVLFIYSFSIIAITLYSYQRLPQLYYLNDEWLSLAGVYVNGIKSVIGDYSLIELLTGKARPLGTLLINTYYLFFPYNILPFAITSYLFHIINSLLVYIFVKKLSKSEFIAIFTGIFFTTASISNQTFSWTANVTQVPTSTTFLLLSLLFMLIYSQKGEFRYFTLSWLFAYIAFLFKDAVFYIFIFLPIYLNLLTKNKKNISKACKVNLILMIPILLLGIYRIISMFGKNVVSMSSNITSLFWLRFLFNSIYYPFISFSQTFIPPTFMFRTSEAFLKFNYPNLIPYISNIGVLSENIISDLIFISLSFIFLIIAIGIYVINKQQRKTMFISCVLYVFSFIPVSVYLFPRGTSYIESRYVYFSVIFVGLILAIILDTFRKIAAKKINIFVITLLIFVLSGLYFYKQIVLIRRDVYKSVINGQNTKDVLTEFSRVLPNLPKKSVIYLTGNSNYYNYMNHPVPLQLDPGYILMVWYYKSGNIPSKLLDVSERLWGFGSQWYEESQGKAFGYYWDKTLLLKEYQSKKFTVDQVIGLYYDGSSKKLIDISSDIKSYLTVNSN